MLIELASSKFKTKPNPLKRNLITILLILAAFRSSAQQTIKGKVIDDNNQSVVSASVILQQKTSKIIAQTSITDSAGIFVLSPKQISKHQLLVNAIGFEISIVDLPDILHRDTTILIRLSKLGQQLNQVSIYARAPLIERKTDRILFNVENSLSAIGGDGIDALSKAPGVRINDDGISIVGKNNIKVMVNEKLLQLSGVDLINYVKSIPSANIKRIEIITNPSARYEADGNSGLINIVLKKNLIQGFNGMINTGGLLASRYTAGLTGIFNYNLEKLHISSNITGVYTEVGSDALSEFSNANSFSSWANHTINKGKGVRGDVRVDYDFSPNTTAGIKYMGGQRNYTLDLFEKGSFYTRPLRLDSSILNTGQDKLKYTLQNFEFYLDHKIDTTGKKIEFASNYFKYGTADNNQFQSTSYGQQNQLLSQYRPVNLFQNERIQIFTNKLDVTLPYSFAELELGAKLSNINSKNNLSYAQQSAAGIFKGNIFDYIENTQSLYASADKDFGKWSIQLGLRLEATQTTGNSSVKNQLQKNNYTELFPTFYLKHAPNENNVFSFTYGRRINRPDYSLFNPARVYSAVNVYQEGNPLLKPSFSNNLELNYNYKDWLSTSFYTNFLSDGFSTLNFFDPVNHVQSLIQLNYARTVTLGLTETVTYNKIGWWESNNQFNVYMDHSSSNGILAEGTIKQWSGYLSTNNTFTLNEKKTLMANTTFWYQFPESSNRLISNAYYAVDVSFRAMFMQRKLTLAVNASDIFKTSQRKYSGLINGVSQFNTLYKDNRKTMLNIVYRFGNSKGNKTARNADNTETNRVKQGF